MAIPVPPNHGPAPGFAGMQQQFGNMNINGPSAHRPANTPHASFDSRSTAVQMKGFKISPTKNFETKGTTWKVAIKGPWSIDDTALLEKVRTQVRGKVTDKYDKLGPNQQNQVDDLIETEMRMERDPHFHWVMAYICAQKKEQPLLSFGAAAPTSHVYVILKRKQRNASGSPASSANRNHTREIVDLNEKELRAFDDRVPRFGPGGPMLHNKPPPNMPHHMPPNMGGPQPGMGMKVNGPPMNGPPMNGPPMNGPPMNGPPMNGMPMNGPPPMHPGGRPGYHTNDPNVTVLPNNPNRQGPPGPGPMPMPMPQGQHMKPGPMPFQPPGGQRPGPPPLHFDVSQGAKHLGRKPSKNNGRAKIHQGRTEDWLHDDRDDHYDSDDSFVMLEDYDSASHRSDPSSRTSAPSSPGYAHKRKDSYPHVKSSGRRDSRGRESDYRMDHRRSSRRSNRDSRDYSSRRSPSPRPRRDSAAYGRPLSSADSYDDHDEPRPRRITDVYESEVHKLASLARILKAERMVHEADEIARDERFIAHQHQQNQRAHAARFAHPPFVARPPPPMAPYAYDPRY